jgi:hypothetical protein
VIPGSHDSTTYSLIDPFEFVPTARTQSKDEDVTAQLNDGIRVFDTLGQLWSLPNPSGSARVIMNNSQCSTVAAHWANVNTPGAWNPYGSGYYANQCTADGKGSGDQSTGIKAKVLAAVKLRATDASFGEPNPLGPAAVGGLYELDIQGTPVADCLNTPLSMLPDEKEVLAALFDQWQTDSATRQNLNIVSADFVEQTELVKDVLIMNGALVGPFSDAPAALVDPSGNYNVFVSTGAGLNHYVHALGAG